MKLVLFTLFAFIAVSFAQFNAQNMFESVQKLGKKLSNVDGNDMSKIHQATTAHFNEMGIEMPHVKELKELIKDHI